MNILKLKIPTGVLTNYHVLEFDRINQYVIQRTNFRVKKESLNKLLTDSDTFKDFLQGNLEGHMLKRFLKECKKLNSSSNKTKIDWHKLCSVIKFLYEKYSNPRKKNNQVEIVFVGAGFFGSDSSFGGFNTVFDALCEIATLGLMSRLDVM